MDATAKPTTSLGEIFRYFLRLGWLAFGGPVGQIGLMHLECVERRRWISEDEFIRALNYCHLLDKTAFMPAGSIDWLTVALGLVAFAVVTFWKWRLNVVVVVLGGGLLGLLCAVVPGLFGGLAG